MQTMIDKPGVKLARGVCRMLSEMDYGTLTEFPTRSGRRMDVCALGPKGQIWCIEVKSSKADFQSDTKWHHYLEWCDRLYFAVPEGFPEELLPLEHGLIRTDEWGAEIIRDTMDEMLPAARRKAITLRYARLASERLNRALAPPTR